MTRSEPRSLDWTKRLIAFDTTSRNSNLDLIETVRDHLSALGLLVSLTYDPDGSKANLFATLPGHEGTTTGGIILSGHTDVVPVDGQDWSTLPFEPVIKDERLYARGSADMKAFLGAMIALAERLSANHLYHPLHLAFSYDEEIGCRGAPAMISDIVKRDIRPAGCIVGEPTMMKVVTAHKGINVYRCTVHGHAAHSSQQNQGVNAIENAASIIAQIRSVARRFEDAGPYEEGFELPFTTAQTGMIGGGIAINTIPDHCSFDFEFRNVPPVNPDDVVNEIRSYADAAVLPDMQRRHSNSAIEFRQIAAAPAFQIDEHADITRLVRSLSGDNGISKVSYGTEAGLFNLSGIPTVVCGPGDISQAHRPDEFIELDQMHKCDLFLDGIGDALQRERSI